MDMRINLHLVRHGRTLWNEQRRYLGHEDQDVLIEALEQLAPLRERMQAIPFTRIYCSDLLRCRQTLNYLLADSEVSAAITEDQLGRGNPDVLYDPRLRELHFGNWEGSTYEDLKDNHLYRRWIDDPAEVTPPNGESWASFRSRVQDFLKGLYIDGTGHELRAGESRALEVLVVTHGGVIRQIAAVTLQNTQFWDVEVSPGEELKLQLSWDGERWQGTRLIR